MVLFFIDKCLPFGAAISCAHFQKVSDAIACLVKVRTKKDLFNYLDDFFFTALMKIWCDEQIKIFLDICKEIGFPVSMEKTVWSVNILTFLGLLIDTIRQLVIIPMDKISKGLNMINEILEKQKCKNSKLKNDGPPIATNLWIFEFSR